MRAPIRITIPTFHAGQVKIWNRRGKRNVVRCGRRFGKTLSIITLACNAAAKGLKVGIFAPTYKQITEPYDAIADILEGIVTSKNKNEGVIKTSTGGKIDFWHLVDNELAGRGREYDLILIDEAAYTKNGQMKGIWHKGIVPTTATKPKAIIWVFSTPFGVDPENFFWFICNDPTEGFVEHHAPSSVNPLVTPKWIEDEKKRLPPEVYQQEIAAEFIDWSGVAFFKPDKWLDAEGKPYPYPTNCDTVFAVIDSALKTGSENDGTAVIYYARNKYSGLPLIILDWEIIQIEADLLATWAPTVVLPRLDELSKLCGAREGVRGVFVEDKGSGIVLNQIAQRKGWPMIPIASDFTALGKDERAIAVSGHFHQRWCGISDYAYNKTTAYKGMTRNHLVSQVVDFRIGDKNAAKRADDLLDCAVYGLGLTFGHQGTF